MTTTAATINGLGPACAPGMGADEGAAGERGQRLSRGQTAAVAVAIVLGVVVAGYGLAGSYLSISDLAAQHDLPLARLVPAGIDGGLVAVVVLDLVLTWIGTPVGWLRQLVRVLSVGTVAANALSGWPDPVATALHAAAPVMLLAMIEAGRTVLLRRIGQANGTRREPIPPARWLLAPWRRTSAKPAPDQLGDTSVWSEIADADRDRFAEAVRLNWQHWMDTGRPISAETLRQRLHVSADTSRKLTRAVRAADRAAAIAASGLT